jgi:hypothetical protein
MLVGLGIDLIRNQSLEEWHFWLSRDVLSDEPEQYFLSTVGPGFIR